MTSTGADDERLRDRLALLQAVSGGFGPEQAEAVLDLRFRRVIRARRSRVQDEVAVVRAALEVPWDPPLEVEATVVGPQRVEVRLGGVAHRVEGEDVAELLDRLVALVVAELASPRRRRVAVRLDLPGGPGLALVDPVGGAEFRYGEPGV